jgi:hypothetical protein
MPTFKPKANKKIPVFQKYTNTIDNKHTEFINEFTKDEVYVIPELLEEKEKIKQQLLSDCSKFTIEEIMELKDRIIEIKKEIAILKQKKNNYLLDNSNLIFEYFENKKNIDGVNDTAKNITNKSQAIFSMFKVKPTSEPNTQDILSKNNNIIIQKYFCNIDETLMDMSMFVRQTDICQSCNKGELIPMEDEGKIVCNACFISLPYLIETDKPSYKEPPKEVCFYAYKRINHWKEIISQFQGKETTQIPPKIIKQIKLQIKKERITLDDLTHIKTKEILKKLGFNKYYEHIAFIKDKLGVKPPIFSPEFEDTLCNLFIEIQIPYAQVCPDYRVNFLNYYYVLYKLCELLGKKEYLQYIPLLKDREKLIEQDEIWKKMSIILNWEFIPTV